MTRDESQAILAVLKGLKAAINDHVRDGFIFKPSVGICGHLNLNLGLGPQTLYSVFNDIGYKSLYPVEMKILSSVENVEAELWYSKTTNKYDSSEFGKQRKILLDKLIQYFEKEIA